MVVHILNIDAITTVSADPADTLFGEYAVPDINLGTTIDQLRQIPGALQALVTEQLDAQGVITWASSDEERVEELVGALSALEPSELARIGRLGIWILASVASQPTVLEQSAGKTDEDLLASLPSRQPLPGRSVPSQTLNPFSKVITPNRPIRCSSRSSIGCSVPSSLGAGPDGRSLKGIGRT